jgi:hypothetical protein
LNSPPLPLDPLVSRPPPPEALPVLVLVLPPAPVLPEALAVLVLPEALVLPEVLAVLVLVLPPVPVLVAPPPPPLPVMPPSFGMQAPPMQTPIGHGVPSGLTGFEQVPFEGLHTPTVWQVSGIGHTTGLPPVHTPDWQVSVWLHALPSSQAVPSETGGLEQPVAGLQTPAVWH